MKISVITVVLNDCSGMPGTLISVNQQTYNDKEYIVIDGGSTDGTMDIIRQHKAWIDCLVSERDQGLYDAMNKGIIRATGEYLCFINSGDCFVSEKTLQQIADYILVNKPDYLYGDALIRDGTRLLYKKARSHRLAWYGMFTNHQSMVYRRDVILANMLLYDTTYKIAADYEFTVRFLKFAHKVGYIPQAFSIFLKGGLSEQRMEDGAKEAGRVRKEVLGCTWVTRLICRILIKLSHFVSRHLGKVYGWLRYGQ